MALTTSVTLTTDFADAVERTRAALTDQGMGVVSEIDMTATLKKKLDVDIEDYLILGACMPGFAHQAITQEPSIGSLLPCNVVVRTNPDNADEVIVEAIDPRTLLSLVGTGELASTADSVQEALVGALNSLSE